MSDGFDGLMLGRPARSHGSRAGYWLRGGKATVSMFAGENAASRDLGSTPAASRMASGVHSQVHVTTFPWPAMSPHRLVCLPSILPLGIRVILKGTTQFTSSYTPILHSYSPHLGCSDNHPPFHQTQPFSNDWLALRKVYDTNMFPFRRDGRRYCHYACF